MKVACLLGSPRSGANSTAIAESFCAGAREQGAEIGIFTLNKLKYRGCQACMACKTKLDHCILEDDLTEVFSAVTEADIVVLASPVYYGDLSSQTKAFIDRTYSFLKPDYLTQAVPSRLPQGKKLVFIQTQAADESMFGDIFSKYDFFFKFYGFDQSLHLRACGVNGPGEVLDNKKLLEEAAAAAGTFCS